MPQGFALEQATSIQVISAYSSSQEPIFAVAGSPGWHVIGAFYLPKSVEAQLDAIAMVSDASLTVRVRLFDLADNQVISGSQTATTATVPTRIRSGIVSLTGNRKYQVQAECTGGDSPDLYAVVSSATLTD